jgi:hypothetical protein
VHEPQIERPEHQDDPDVHHQPLPEPIPEEQDIDADHDSYQREHVKHDGCLSSHPAVLLRSDVTKQQHCHRPAEPARTNRSHRRVKDRVEFTSGFGAFRRQGRPPPGRLMRTLDPEPT